MRALTIGILFLGVCELSAKTLYVSPAASHPDPPYTNWDSAAHTIGEAARRAAPGDEVLVTNGTYNTGSQSVGTNTVENRVLVPSGVSVRSVNGPQVTVIEGSQQPPVRGVYLSTNAELSGFTVTNGAALFFITQDNQQDREGGGIMCESTAAVVSNCVIAGNRAFEGGGVAFATLRNSVISSNLAVSAGGALASELIGCTVQGNQAITQGQWDGNGGGVATSHLTNCTVADNWAGEYAGGANSCKLVNCKVSNNRAGAWGGGTTFSAMYNCTVVGNSAGNDGGGIFCSGATNCIVYYNAAPDHPNCYEDRFSPGLHYCCTTPLPTNGVGNITAEPRFLDGPGGGLRLMSDSPCINAGESAFALAQTDLNGDPRIVSATVDIGACEFQGSGSLISYAWLQQYGLPRDGSADYLDSDGDQMNNWQEWRCHSDPANASSRLQFISAVPQGNSLVLTWQSAAGVSYALERSPDPGSPFTSLVTGIVGEPFTTSYTHTNAVENGALFYRVCVPY